MLEENDDTLCDAKELEYYNEWRQRTIFLPLSEINNIWEKYPTARIPENSSWYAIVNNEAELIELIGRVDGDLYPFLQNSIIKQVYLSDNGYTEERDDPCIMFDEDYTDEQDDKYTLFVKEANNQEEEWYSVNYNEFFERDTQLQLTKESSIRELIRDNIVLTDDAKHNIKYPLMLDYYYNRGEDRVGKYTINLVSLKTLTNMQPREGDMKIHFWGFL